LSHQRLLITQKACWCCLYANHAPLRPVIALSVVCSTFPGGDQCGEPLCSTLRVNIDGDVYATAAYTQSSTGTVAAVQDADCIALPMNWGTLWPNTCNTLLPGLTRVASPRAGNQTAGQGFSFDVSTANSFDVSTANYGYGGHNDESYYPATAIVISGSITSSNGQKHGCYNEGTIEVRC